MQAQMLTRLPPPPPTSNPLALHIVYHGHTPLRLPLHLPAQRGPQPSPRADLAPSPHLCVTDGHSRGQVH